MVASYWHMIIGLAWQRTLGTLGLTSRPRQILAVIVTVTVAVLLSPVFAAFLIALGLALFVVHGVVGAAETDRDLRDRVEALSLRLAKSSRRQA